MEQKRELGCYIISGGVTTAVNYVLYAAFLALHLDYLVANGLAWCGAVVAAYWMNRKWVFRSENAVGREFFSFAAARLLTLAVESACLWIAIDCLHILPIPAKLLVSVVTVVGNYVLCKYKIFASEGA